jgi:UDP-2,4-diacetamido-2,4,6-trideoxy-beta-L-altropyranose hydrolase
VNYFIRDAEINDAHQILEWRNHPIVKKNCFTENEITLDTHLHWFKEKLKDRNSFIYILSSKIENLGMIRFDIIDEIAKVSVMLGPNFLGKGLGTEIIRLGTDRFKKDGKANIKVVAEVKTTNIASLKAFAKAGYKEEKVMLVF